MRDRYLRQAPGGGGGGMLTLVDTDGPDDCEEKKHENGHVTPY